MKNYDGLYARIGDEWVQVFRPSDIEKFIEELENAKAQTSPSEMTIDKVIFSGPATIVFWADGEKTVVKCMDGDLFTYDVGIYVATLKKIFGESFSEYKKDVKRLVEEQVDKEEKKLAEKAKGEEDIYANAYESMAKCISEGLNKFVEGLKND